MTVPWKTYWELHDEQIRSGISKWRKHGFARVALRDLRLQLAPSGSPRNDLYACVKVYIHGVRSGASGRRHLEALAQYVAPLLKEGDTLTLCIKGRDSATDCLEFS